MELSLTSIQEPPSAPAVPLETIRQQIKALEATHKEKGTQLSGRILHVTVRPACFTFSELFETCRLLARVVARVECWILARHFSFKGPRTKEVLI
jgi:hypothetical protein